jgi:hypothetical protein
MRDAPDLGVAIVRKACLLAALVIGTFLLAFVAGCGSGTDGAKEVTSTSSVAATVVTLAADRLEALQSRVAEWSALISSVRDTGADKTAEIARYLWPRAEAETRAAEYQEMWWSGVDSSESIAWRAFGGVVRVGASDTGTDAVVLVKNEFTGADGSITEGLEAVTWTYQEGQWYRTTSFWVPDSGPGGRQTLEKTVSVGYMSWSPVSVEEVTQLTADAGIPAEGKVFLVVTMYVFNGGDGIEIPADYGLKLYGRDGTQLEYTEVFDELFPGSMRLREMAMDSGIDLQLTYCFEAPEGLDLSGLQYEVESAK